MAVDRTVGRLDAVEDPHWPRASAWLSGAAETSRSTGLHVTGVPTSIGSISPSRADTTPAVFRTALRRFPTFDAVAGVGLESLTAVDRGDWPLAHLDLDSVQEEIHSRAAALDRDPVHVFIGGDNSITRPLLRGLAGDRLPNVGLVTVDAHHDFRILDSGPLNGTPVRGLVEDGVDATSIHQIGIGRLTNSGEYRSECDRLGIKVTMADDMADAGAVMAAALEEMAERVDWVFVDFDIDVLDSAFAPGCHGARPGGITPAQLMAAAHAAGRHRSVRAADFVEVDAEADAGGITVDALAGAFVAFAAGVAARSGS